MANGKSKEPDLSQHFEQASKQIATNFKKSIKFGKEALKSVRPLSKYEVLNFKKARIFIPKYEAKIIARYIKQERCKLLFKKTPYSFLITQNSLQPYLESELDIIKKIDVHIAERFKEDLQKRFAERSWYTTQEYIGTNILGLRNIKKLLTLALFSDPIRIQLLNVREQEQELIIDIFSRLNRTLYITFSEKAEKDHDIVIKGQLSEKNRFTEMAEKIISGQTYQPNIDDLEFLANYLKKALEIEPIMPPNLTEKTKELILSLKSKEKSLKYNVTERTIAAIMNMIKASARLELRAEIRAKDLERVFSILNEK
jgi:DNA replicative helicase MCM subunit Mcm2 (Cdc46/Mcm family)